MALIRSFPRPADLACRLGRHRKPAIVVWHEGWSVGDCGHCGTEVCLPPMGGRWTTVANGYRIVWEEPSEELQAFRRLAGLWDGEGTTKAVPVIVPISEITIPETRASPLVAAAEPAPVPEPEPVAIHRVEAPVAAREEPLLLDMRHVERAIAQAIPAPAAAPKMAPPSRNRPSPEPARFESIVPQRRSAPRRAGLKDRASVRHELRIVARVAFRRASPTSVWRAA